MSEDRLSSFFRKLDAPLEPNREFAEELFESLAADLGFRPIGRRTAVARRIRRALGPGRVPAGPAPPGGPSASSGGRLARPLCGSPTWWRSWGCSSLPDWSWYRSAPLCCGSDL